MDVTPMERARQFKTLKDQHGTLEATAGIAGVSAASVSRYLNLLALPVEVQQRVDAGELPVSKPLAALRRKSTDRSDRKTALSEQHRILLNTLARTRFATQAQLSQYVGRSPAQTRTYLLELAAYGLTDAHREFRPHAFFLTVKGCELQDVTKPKHVISASVIHQQLLRNQIELAMREKNPSACFASRSECWAMGFHPTVAEHLVSFEHDGNTRHALVLIDDYAMAPSRVLHVLNRPHDENKTKVAVTGHHVMRWPDLVDTVLVYSTNPRFRGALENAIGSLTTPFHNITLGVRDIAPLWEFV